MLRPDEVMELIENLLASGVDRRDEIVAAVAQEVDLDNCTLRRMAADKAVSLCLAAMRDDNGDRLAFPSRDDEGNRVVVHVNYTHDATAMHRAGVHMENVGKSMVRSGKKLQDRAVQLGLFDAEAA